MAGIRTFLFRTRLGKAITLGVFALGVTLVLGEVLCQAIFARQMREWEEVKRNPAHCFMKSDNPKLGYELRPGFQGVFDGRAIHINKHGLRDDSDELFADKRRIAIFGDSVAFSINVGQNETVVARLQELLDPGVTTTRVVNFGVSGYGLMELPEFLKHVGPVYKPDTIVYLLNLNDFSVRGTIYEGGDNGLYRMYNPPTLKLPAAIRKVVYRSKKGGSSCSAPWYRWMFDGTKSYVLPKVLELRDQTKAMGADFFVIILPSATVTEPGGDRVRAMSAEIGDYLKAAGISYADATPSYEGHWAAWLDDTDHNTVEGNIALAKVITEKALGVKP